MTEVSQHADAALRHLFEQMCAAWTAGSAADYGACFVQDCDYVSYDGSHARGRQAMVASHDKLFRGVLHGSKLIGQVESIRYVRPEVAVMHATGSVLMPWRSRLPRRRMSRQTIVAVNEHGRWRVAALHNGRVRPVTIPGPDSAASRASQTMTKLARKLHIGHRPD